MMFHTLFTNTSFPSRFPPSAALASSAAYRQTKKKHLHNTDTPLRILPSAPAPVASLLPALSDIHREYEIKQRDNTGEKLLHARFRGKRKYR